MTKTCARCSRSRPVEEFTTDRAKRDGRGSYCRGCRPEMHAEWRRTRPDLVAKAGRQSRAKMTREQRRTALDRANASRRRRYAEDPDYRRRIREAQATRYATNPELRGKLIERATTRNRTHPDRIIEAAHRRRARIAEVSVGPVSRERVMERDGWTCWVCDLPTNRAPGAPRSERPSLDHVIALSDGGAHTEDNLRCAHLGCNIRRYHEQRRQRRAIETAA